MSPERLAEIEARLRDEDEAAARIVDRVAARKRERGEPPDGWDPTAQLRADTRALLVEVCQLSAQLSHVVSGERLMEAERERDEARRLVAHLRALLRDARQRCEVDNDHDADNDGQNCDGESP